jgi:hypothetical protein
MRVMVLVKAKAGIMPSTGEGSVPDDRAANQPLRVTTFRPSIGGTVPGRADELCDNRLAGQVQCLDRRRASDAAEVGFDCIEEKVAKHANPQRERSSGRGNQKRDRWFESGSLQRRVGQTAERPTGSTADPAKALGDISIEVVDDREPRHFRGRPKDLSLTAASTAAGWCASRSKRGEWLWRQVSLPIRWHFSIAWPKTRRRLCSETFSFRTWRSSDWREQRSAAGVRRNLAKAGHAERFCCFLLRN